MENIQKKSHFKINQIIRKTINQTIRKTIPK